MILNNEFKKIIEKNKDRIIYVPLSGGLDSRLVLCKLLENNCKNLITFSYGTKGNFESIKSKKISQKLGVKWIFLNTKKIKSEFFSQKRRKYSQIGFGKFLTPMREYFAIKQLKIKNRSKNITIINGQTGDFLSGGQLPPPFFKNKINLNLFINEIINKHISYWKDDAYKHQIKLILKKKYNFLKNASKEKKISEFEKWNFYNRQANIVITDVILYDYFKFDWELPLWCENVVNFFNRLPINERLGKKFYLEYLKMYNYKNSFLTTSVGSSWTIYTFWVKYLANFLGIFDKRLKVFLYNFMKYFGHYKYLYSWIDFKFYLKNFNKIKNQEAFLTQQIIKENKNFLKYE